MAAPELVIAALLPSEAGAIFSIRLWAGMVGVDNAAAILDGFRTDPDGATSSWFELGVILAPVADAVSGISSLRKKHTMSRRPQLFTQTGR